MGHHRKQPPDVVLTVVRSAAVLGAVVGVALLGCQATAVPSSTPTPIASPNSSPAAPTTAPTTPSPAVPASATPSASPSSCADSGSTGTFVVYQDGDDLWLYDVANDESRRLTDDGDARSDHSPAFVNGSCIVHGSNSSIELLDLVSGRSRRLVEEEANIGSLAVSPDGTTLLYMHIDYDVDGTFRLKRIDVDGGQPEVIHTFPQNLGRGASSEDEVSVAWAPDGASILVANTHEFSREFEWGSIYLFDTAGSQLQRWAGTHPRWSPDGRTIYYREHGGLQGRQDWHSMNVRTLQSTAIGIRPATNSLTVSPDGRRVAYDTSVFGDTPGGGGSYPNARPDVYVYNLSTGKERLLQRGGVAAIWISATEVVITDAKGDPPNCWCTWEELGTVTLRSVDGDSRAVNMGRTTFGTAVYGG